MNEKIFIPKTITVGYQKRNDTYTGKLAYIIYTDQKGVLRKEKSWEGWRDKEIEAEQFENIPTAGFVLNKKVGGNGGWNPRQTYTRVYDSRGFEFEIIISNLLYILENTNSIKGKGLDGEFVYGWYGSELVLVPVDAPEYKQMLEFTDNQGVKFSKKDLIPGWKYLNKKNKVFTYLGYFDEYDDFTKFCYDQKYIGKRYWFYDHTDKKFITFSNYNTLVKKIEEDNNYAFLLDRLEKNPRYSRVNKELSYFKESSEEEVFKLCKEGDALRFDYFIDCGDLIVHQSIYQWNTENYIKNHNIKLNGYYYCNNSLKDIKLGYPEKYILIQNISVSQKIYIINLILENGKETYR